MLMQAVIARALPRPFSHRAVPPRACCFPACPYCCYYHARLSRRASALPSLRHGRRAPGSSRPAERVLTTGGRTRLATTRAPSASRSRRARSTCSSPRATPQAGWCRASTCPPSTVSRPRACPPVCRLTRLGIADMVQGSLQMLSAIARKDLLAAATTNAKYVTGELDALIADDTWYARASGAQTTARLTPRRLTQRPLHDTWGNPLQCVPPHRHLARTLMCPQRLRARVHRRLQGVRRRRVPPEGGRGLGDDPGQPAHVESEPHGVQQECARLPRVRLPSMDAEIWWMVASVMGAIAPGSTVRMSGSVRISG
jgi:hypothetical protein